MGKKALRCYICGKVSLNIRTCSLCGSPVCPQCFDETRSVCVKCLKRSSRGPKRPSTGSDDIYGPLS